MDKKEMAAYLAQGVALNAKRQVVGQYIMDYLAEQMPVPVFGEIVLIEVLLNLQNGMLKSADKCIKDLEAATDSESQTVGTDTMVDEIDNIIRFRTEAEKRFGRLMMMVDVMMGVMIEEHGETISKKKGAKK